jgi:hypothetical protein
MATKSEEQPLVVEEDVDRALGGKDPEPPKSEIMTVWDSLAGFELKSSIAKHLKADQLVQYQPRPQSSKNAQSRRDNKRKAQRKARRKNRKN